MQYIQRITEKHQPLLKQFFVTLPQAMTSFNEFPPFEVSKVASTYRNFHIIIATIQTIEYWIRRLKKKIVVQKIF